MNEFFLKDEIVIKNLIYEIRCRHVMLDSVLARLYETETKRINEAVRNNLDKFPERFSLVLTNDEEKNLKSKISTSSLTRSYGGRRYNTRVFTEQGVAMLATVLRTEVAEEVSFKIVDAFVAMKHYVSDNLIEQNY